MSRRPSDVRCFSSLPLSLFYLFFLRFFSLSLSLSLSSFSSSSFLLLLFFVFFFFLSSLLWMKEPWTIRSFLIDISRRACTFLSRNTWGFLRESRAVNTTHLQFRSAHDRSLLISSSGYDVPSYFRASAYPSFFRASFADRMVESLQNMRETSKAIS